VDKRCKTAAPEQFRDAGLVVAALRVQNCLLKDREIAMQKEQARESNVFQLNTRVRKLDKGFREPNEIPEHVRHRLAERTDAALDQLLTILDGRRGH
jgi:hypothetical protein